MVRVRIPPFRPPHHSPAAAGWRRGASHSAWACPMKAGIVVFPGINRERDMVIALETSFGAKPRMIWHKDTDLGGVDLVVVPGGFSFGDYLRCGAMAAQSPIMRAIHAHAATG